MLEEQTDICIPISLPYNFFHNQWKDYLEHEQIASPLLWSFLSKKGTIERMSNNKISVPNLGDGEIVPSTQHTKNYSGRDSWSCLMTETGKKTFSTVLDKNKSDKNEKFK